jgi:hypothetical protein
LWFDQLRLGAVSGVDSGTSGAMLFDDVAAQRDTHVGPLARLAPQWKVGQRAPVHVRLGLIPPLQAEQTETPTPTLPLTPVPPSGPVTIEYAYDPLYRLTEADSSNGSFYHYNYDAVATGWRRRRTATTWPTG